MATKKNVVAMNQDIPTQLETLRADIANLTKTIEVQAKSAVAEKAGKAKDIAAEKAEVAKVKYDQLSSQAETTIRENPLTSVAIAVGAGLLLGALTRR